MEINPEREMERAISNAKEFSFTTVGQFAAVMSSSGYDYKMEKENDSIEFFRHGVEIGKVSYSGIAELAHENMLKIQHDEKTTSSKTDKRKKQLKAIIKKSHDDFPGRQQYQTFLKKKYGIALVFHGSADSPFGYTLIDNSRKMVFPGKEILPIKQMLKFPSDEDIARKKDTGGVQQRANSSAAKVSKGRHPSETQTPNVAGKPNLGAGTDGSHYANREWEVGNHESLDDQDRQIKL